jgi:CO/xanthine dehydrogenase FAD-binding subunit
MSVYACPASLADALALVAQGPVRVLAGGTDIYPGAGADLSGDVLDLTAIAELTQISHNAVGLRIGAAVRWAQIAQATGLPPALCALQEAARKVGGRQIQNAGTLGGNLCNASPAADGVPPLLVLGAEVELASARGTRRMALGDFLTGPRRVALEGGEIMTAVLLPEAELQGASAFEKLGARTHLVISIAMVAARIEVAQGKIAQAAIAVGSCSGVAQRLAVVEASLIGAVISEVNDRVRAADVAAALSPIDDVRATSSYRLEAATELVRRAVSRAAESAT